MDARKLASLLRGGPGGPLVIDSRSFVEYNRWHVLSSVNICCSKLVKRRLQQGKVTIAELIQPAVRSQVPARPVLLPASPPLPGSRHPQVQGWAPQPGVQDHVRGSRPHPALEPKPDPSRSKCSEPPSPGLLWTAPLLLQLPSPGRLSLTPSPLPLSGSSLSLAWRFSHTPDKAMSQGPSMGPERGAEWMSEM